MAEEEEEELPVPLLVVVEEEQVVPTLDRLLNLRVVQATPTLWQLLSLGRTIRGPQEIQPHSVLRRWLPKEELVA